MFKFDCVKKAFFIKDILRLLKNIITFIVKFNK